MESYERFQEHARTGVERLPVDPIAVAEVVSLGRGSKACAVSVVVPVRNEEGSLPELTNGITRALEREGSRFEIILIDDGSSDDSWWVMLDLSASQRHIRAVRHRRNFGKAAALSTGFSVATGRTIITMDGDLQDDPAEIPRFLEGIRGGSDAVSGWKKVRRDPVTKRAPSKVFNAVARRTSGLALHDFNCGFKAYTAQAAELLKPYLYGEMHRYLPVILGAHGFRVSELEVNHRARQFGQSNYGFSRVFKGAFDLLTVVLLGRYRYRPLHAIGGAAVVVLIVAAAFSMLFGLLGSGTVALGAMLSGVLLGAILLGTGLVGELVVHSMGPPPLGAQVEQSTWAPGPSQREQPHAVADPIPGHTRVHPRRQRFVPAPHES
jgi:dolichol-phosphate mannosyltransferase